MALTGLEIFKYLPKTNCGECGIPTCLAFAMKIAAGGASLEACPHVTEEAKNALSSAAAPPMRGVTIGVGDNATKVGEELVLFRHEKTFFNPPGFALLVDDLMNQKELENKIRQAKNATWNRVGQILKANLIAIKNSSNDSSKFIELIKKVKDSIDLPLIIMTENAEVAGKALDVVGTSKPLIYAATEENIEAMSTLAKTFKTPLAVKASSLESLAALTSKLEEEGLKDLVIDPGSRNLKETFKNLIFLRRAALKKKQRPYGYPTIVFPAEETDDFMMEAIFAAIYVMKYGSLIVMKDLSPEKAYPLFVLRQNIFTDPQRPMQMEAGFYQINSPDENSPVLVTTNFSLTYFIVSSEIETSKMPAWLGIVDAEGMSVLTAWAAGKFVPDRVASFIKKSGIEEKVNHRNLVIPGYVAQLSGELEDELKDWKVIVGPREASDITEFLRNYQPVKC